VEGVRGSEVSAMSKSGEIEVRVTDRATGAPIPEAEVALFLLRVRDEPSGRFEQEARLEVARADASGRLVHRIDFGDDDKIEVQTVVRARGRKEWKSPQLRWDRESMAKNPPAELLQAGGRLRIDAELDRGVTIEGSVRTPDGRAIKRVHVGLVLSMPNACSWPYAFSVAEGAAWPPRCFTDSRGAFEWLSFPIEFAREEAGAHYVLTAEEAGHCPALVHRVEELPPDADGVIHVDLVLSEGTTLKGSVRGPTGAPASGAMVEARLLHQSGAPVCVSFEKRVVTDEAGSFTLRGLDRARHRLEVEMDGCAPLCRELDLGAGAPDSLDLELEPGVDLRGRVVDRAGAPISGARISAFVREPLVSRTVQTDEDGRFEVRGLPATGSVEISSVRSIRRTVELPSEPIALQAPALVDLELRLLADEDGRPLEPPGDVVVLAPGFSMRLPMESGGRVHVPDTPVGHYEFRSSLPERAPTSREVDVGESNASEPIVLRVSRGGAVRGRVADEDGRPIAGVKVTAFGRILIEAREAVTNDVGEFELRGLDREAYVVFRRERFALRAIPMQETGTPEAPARLDVTMKRGATITGRLLGEDGKPLVRSKVTVAFKAIAFFPVELPNALTDRDGRFLLECVPEGDFVVTGEGAEVAVKTRHGERLEVELVSLRGPRPTRP
jgi:carboxypeptidase family protein